MGDQRFSPWKPPMRWCFQVKRKKEALVLTKSEEDMGARHTWAHLKRPLQSFPYIWLPIRLTYYGAKDGGRRKKSTNALKVFSCALPARLYCFAYSKALKIRTKQIKVLFLSLMTGLVTGSVRSLNWIRMDDYLDGRHVLKDF